MTQYEIPNESKKKKSARIPIDKLHDFDGHPFKVTDNEDPGDSDQLTLKKRHRQGPG